jgi:hypothetical protein
MSIVNPIKYTNNSKRLNPSVMDNSFDVTYKPVDCSSSSCESCYASEDPFVSRFNGERLELDQPPFTHNKKADIYNDMNANKYGKNYSNYSDIDGGQITYYDDEFDNALQSPLFVTGATQIKSVFVDPMGLATPQYKRQPETKCRPFERENGEYIGCLSWMEDTLGHREDIMNAQMSVMNKNRWTNTN